MVWIRSVRCEKIKQDIVAQIFALIPPVWRVLQQVSCSSKTVPNAPKRKGTHQNLSLGSNGVDREHSLRKNLTRHRGTNFCINCTSLACFAQSSMQQRNHSKSPKTERNAPKHEFRVLWCGSGAFIAKNSSAKSWHEILH